MSAVKQTLVLEKTQTGEIKGGKNFKRLFDELPAGRYQIEVTKYRKKRSLQQNRFYFSNFIQSQIDCFKERWGYSYDKDQVHNWNKANFWAETKIDESTGEIIKLPASSTENTTVSWEEKMDIIRSWFHEHMDWILPYPLQQSEMFE